MGLYLVTPSPQTQGTYHSVKFARMDTSKNRTIRDEFYLGSIEFNGYLFSRVKTFRPQSLIFSQKQNTVSSLSMHLEFVSDIEKKKCVVVPINPIQPKIFQQTETPPHQKKMVPLITITEDTQLCHSITLFYSY